MYPVTTYYRRVFQKRLENGDRLTAVAELHSIGDGKPYFAITGSIIAKRYRNPYACGCLHEEILKAWPKLKFFVDLHLSSQYGFPTYMFENGWFHAGGSAKEFPNASPNVEGLAEHLRIPLEEAKEIVNKVVNGKMTKRQFFNLVDKQKPRMMKEAEEAIEFLKTGIIPKTKEKNIVETLKKK